VNSSTTIQEQHANLVRANFEGANLSGANLKGANLKGAENFTPIQVKQARNWEKANYDKGFRAKLGLPPELGK